MPKSERLKKGNWYWVDWVDIATGNGDVAQARVYFRKQCLRFVGYATRRYDNMSCRYARFALLQEEDPRDYTDCDWYAIPVACIRRTALAERSEIR